VITVGDTAKNLYPMGPLDEGNRPASYVVTEGQTLSRSAAHVPGSSSSMALVG
jgi:hypothetical protein